MSSPMLPMLETACTPCAGSGRVQDDRWEGWLKRWHETEQAHKAEHPDADWTKVRQAAEAAAGPQPTCPEETVCGECDGAGAVPTEAGQAVLGFLTRMGKRVL